jgi:hypothetical protein
LSTKTIRFAGQIALTLLLLTSAAAAMNGFVRLIRANLGYDPHNTMSVGIPVRQNSHVSWGERSTYFAQLLKRIQAMPEVVAAGISTNATPPSNGWELSFEIFGRPSGKREQARVNFISPEYFPVLRIPLPAGASLGRAGSCAGREPGRDQSNHGAAVLAERRRAWQAGAAPRSQG